MPLWKRRPSQKMWDCKAHLSRLADKWVSAWWALNLPRLAGSLPRQLGVWRIDRCHFLCWPYLHTRGVRPSFWGWTGSLFALWELASSSHRSGPLRGDRIFSCWACQLLPPQALPLRPRGSLLCLPCHGEGLKSATLMEKGRGRPRFAGTGCWAGSARTRGHGNAGPWQPA